jgi:hypothetical protein
LEKDPLSLENEIYPIELGTFFKKTMPRMWANVSFKDNMLALVVFKRILG